MQIQIRRAQENDAHRLTQLAIRSKAHWGYSETFMQAAIPELTVTPAQLSVEKAFVLEQGGTLLGFYKLRRVTPMQAELTDLFLEPSAMGHGWGRVLWEHAVATARAEGYAELVWESDPFAEGFYLHMGATRSGVVESNVQPGRLLPRMRYLL